MSITCEACGYTNPADVEFCAACGSELSQVAPLPPSPPVTEPETLIPEPLPIAADLELNFDAPLAPPPPPITESEVTNVPIPLKSSTSSPTPDDRLGTADLGMAKLIARLPNAPIAEFLLDSTSCLIGRFDPDSGPVEVDLDGFPGDDTISRNHAEIYQESGSWKIKDLGSTNGVFIKRAGENRYGARITTPQPLWSGDEVAIAKIRFLFQMD
ncbi:FHA domain-containing protein [Synechocystis sp. PCC 7339]|uniref:FHA domain-containing protein n=1 Tax=Synechocystis sp. PCC 7339 TaxID=2782213 RepID=UPI001CBBFB8A|nr:FHA domain-containing protein [Synechocystis sp. PCC 7339]UAJ72063.1 FHA domain-containing protein [Synechocystis sp. PCC 7339]